MYPPPTPESLRMLHQLRDRKRLKCGAEQNDNDEYDMEEVIEFLSAVVDTPLKPVHADATGTTQVGVSALVRNTHERGNSVPTTHLVDEVSRRASGNSRRKRALCEVEGNVDDANKAARTRKDSTAGKLRADTVEPDTTDSFHSILARHSYDRDTFDAFKSTISKCLFAELGDFVNSASDDEVDPFTSRASPQDPPSVDEEAGSEDTLDRASDALATLAGEPLVEEREDAPRILDGETNSEGCMTSGIEPSILGEALTPFERASLTKFINESLDDDIEWTPFQPTAESSMYRGFRVVHPLVRDADGVDLEESDDDTSSAPTSSTSERISVSTAATTPPSILRRRNGPPTPISERKRVRFSKKNIRATCSTAGDSPSLIISPRPSTSSLPSSTPTPTISPTTSSSAPMTRATLRRAQEARQARIDVLKSSRFCKIIDEYTVRCQLCKVNIGLGVDQVYDTRVWKKHEVEEDHTSAEREREERRAERRRNKGKERDT